MPEKAPRSHPNASESSSPDWRTKYKELEKKTQGADSGARIDARMELSKMLQNGEMPDADTLDALTAHDDMGLRIDATVALEKMIQSGDVSDPTRLEQLKSSARMEIRMAARQ